MSSSGTAVWVVIVVILFVLLLLFLASKMWHKRPHVEVAAAPAATIVSASSNPPHVEVATLGASAEPPMAYYGHGHGHHHHHYHPYDDDLWMSYGGGTQADPYLSPADALEHQHLHPYEIASV